jgi:hypothetical protein
MQRRFYLIAVPLMATSDGHERSVEASSSSFHGPAERLGDGPAGTPNREDL